MWLYRSNGLLLTVLYVVSGGMPAGHISKEEFPQEFDLWPLFSFHKSDFLLLVRNTVNCPPPRKRFPGSQCQHASFPHFLTVLCTFFPSKVGRGGGRASVRRRPCSKSQSRAQRDKTFVAIVWHLLPVILQQNVVIKLYFVSKSIIFSVF